MIQKLIVPYSTTSSGGGRNNSAMNHRRRGVGNNHSGEKSPTIPAWESLDPPKKKMMSPPHATIAKSPPALGVAPRLRRTKSLPADFSYHHHDETMWENLNHHNGSSNHRSGKKDDDESHLFWFRPEPERPFSDSPAVTPPRKSSKLRELKNNKRRHKKSPCVVIPQELNLPTLREEEPPTTTTMLRSYLAGRDDSSNSIYDYSEYEEEDDLDLRGLSLLEERDE